MKKNYLVIIALFAVQMVFSQDWNTNFKQAIDSAKAQNKYVLLVFSGSDWCANCIRLKDQILTKDDFKSKVESQFIIVNADFPQKKKAKETQPQELKDQNKKLIETYNQGSVFPLVVVIDSSEKALGKVGNEKCSPSEYAEKLIAYIPK